MKHKIKNQIKQRLSDKLIVTGKRKSIERNIGNSIAENFRKIRKKSQKNVIKNQLEQASIEEESEPDSSSNNGTDDIKYPKNKSTNQSQTVQQDK